MKITVKQVRQYGRIDTYPVCETAKKLLALTGRAVFNVKHIEIIESLGFTVEVQASE